MANEDKRMNTGVQFYALPEEVLRFLLRQIDDFSLHVATIRHFPYEVVKIDKAALGGAFADPSVWGLMLTVDLPKIPATGRNDLLDNNPDALLLDIGRRSEKGLTESWMTVRASAPEAVAVWSKVVRRLKAMTRVGATAINPKTGATARARNQRYTDGAKALNDEGVTMLPMAGGAILKLG
jgi:hypothetical protein